jgi:membrane protein YqaA with SNARE-associated domain
MVHRSQLLARAWLDRLDRFSHALPLLFALSVAETLIIPIPIETILIPWMLSHPRRRWAIATLALAGNITAAAIGCWLGVLAMEQWGETLIALFGSAETYESLAEQIRSNESMSILAVGVTPTPLQMAMLAAGATGYSFWLFLFALTLSRSLRYYGLAVLVHFSGDAALGLWKRYSKQIGVALLILTGIWLWFVFG